MRVEPTPRFRRYVERGAGFLPQPRQQPLAAAVPIDVGGVEEVDPVLEGASERRHRLVVVDGPPGTTNRPGPEAQCGHAPACAAQLPVFHTFLLAKVRE